MSNLKEETQASTARKKQQALQKKQHIYQKRHDIVSLAREIMLSSINDGTVLDDELCLATASNFYNRMDEYIKNGVINDEHNG